MIITKQEAAAELGMSTSSLEYQEKKYGPIPSTFEKKRRVMRVRDVIEWEVNRRLSDAIGDADEESQVFDGRKEKARLTHFQANKTELEVRKLEGDLIDAEETLFEWLKLVKQFRKTMLTIPNRVSNELSIAVDEITIKEILNREIKEALHELAQDPSDDPAGAQGDNPTT